MTPVGLDLSCTSTGYAVWGGDVGRIRTNLACHRGMTDIEKRRHIGEGISVLLRTGDSGQADHLVVIEAPFAGPNRKTSRDLFMLHAVVLDRLPWDRPVAYVPPSVLKVHLAGRSDADKQQMIAAAQDVGYPGKQNDEADAWGLALLGHHLLGGQAFLTAQRSACLASVAWEVPLLEAVAP